MNGTNDLVQQALRTYQRIKFRLETALENQKKFASYRRPTTASMALQGRIEYLSELQAKAYKRYLRRKEKFEEL